MLHDCFRRTALALFISLAAPTPGFAEEQMPAPAKDYAGMSPSRLGEELRAFTDDAPPCEVGVPLFSRAYALRPDVESIRNALYQLRVRCAMARDAHREALDIFRRWEDEGTPLSQSYGLMLAANADDGAEIAARLEALLVSGDRAVLAALNPDLVFFALRKAASAGMTREIERISAAGARAGAIDLLPADLQPVIAYRALKDAVSWRDQPRARRLLAYLNRPSTYADLLGLREFEPVWPEVEARAGQHFRTITQEYRATALARRAAAPDDSEALNDAAHALYFDGDFSGAIALVSEATNRPDLAQTLVEDEAWALNIKAYALDALGRTAEADAVFDLIGFGDGNTDVGDRGWQVNFAINRGSRMVGQGRWTEGLAAAEFAAEIAGQHGSPYARSLTLRDRICALNGLGRSGETASLLEQLHTEGAEAPGIVAEGLMCLGRNDEAADLLVAALANEDLRASLLSDLQDETFDLFYTRSILPKARDLLATHPALREAFLQHARFIPEEFRPAASLAR